MGRENRAKKGATGIPQATQRPAEPVKRYKSCLTPLPASMACSAPERFHAIRLNCCSEQQHKGRDQQHDPQQFPAIFPRPQARTLQSQRAFARAQTGFNLPSPLVRKKDLPGLSCGLNPFSGQHLPAFPCEARFDYVQVLRVCGVTNRRPPQVARACEATAACADQLVRQIALSPSHLPDCLCSSLWIVQEVLLDPATDASHPQALPHFQPRTRSRAASKDQGQQRSPGAHPQAQHLLLLRAELFCRVPCAGPPAPARELGNAFQSRHAGSCPVPAHHPNGSQGRQVKEHSGAVHAFGCAGKHRPCGCELAAFGLLDHTSITPAEHTLPLPLEPLQLCGGFLKHKALTVQGAPSKGAPQLPHPLGACGRRLGESHISSQLRASCAPHESLLVVAEAQEGDTTLHQCCDQPCIQHRSAHQQQWREKGFEQVGAFLGCADLCLICLGKYGIRGLQQGNDLLAHLRM